MRFRNFLPFNICLIGITLSPFLHGQEKALNPVPIDDAKNAWKMAQANTTSSDMISVPPGFEVELVRSANDDEGSWITLEFDNRGHLFVAKEDKGILRFSVDGNGQLIDKLLVNNEIDQCRGLLWAPVTPKELKEARDRGEPDPIPALYVNSNNSMMPPQQIKPNSNGLFRLRDLNNDGVFEDVEKLLETRQEMPGHGRNQLRLGPDNMIYFMTGYDVYLSDKVDLKRSFLRNFREDNLIPNPWDEEWFNKHANAPGGHLVRMDKNGRYFQLIAAGFRNPMDIAFNKNKEIFTFDADMEWDAALPWYKPTRILHVVSGGDYGWRRATAKWPEYYEDSLPSAVDIGLGSPTGIEFGYQSTFPDRWKDTLFVGDWTYGRIIAVNLEEDGASYGGNFETFASGRPMNVVDITFGPDGNLYFVTGGMKTKSGIYRIKWTGKETTSSLATTAEAPKTNSEVRNLRYKLEFYHVLKADDGAGAKLALQNLNHPDDFVRHAARIALENQDPKFWASEALAGTAPSGFISIARTDLVENEKLINRMNRIKLEELSEKDLLGMLRAYQLHLSRHGMPAPNERSTLITNLSKLFPSESTNVNHEAAELLVYLEAPQVLPQLITLINESETTEDLAQYLVYARYIDTGWDLEFKRSYLKGVQRLEAFPGGKFHQKVVDYLRKEIIGRLTEPETMALAKWMVPDESRMPKTPKIENITFVKNWQVEDFDSYFDKKLTGRDFEQGQLAYTKSNCAACHQMSGNQASMKGVAGPILSTVGGRFGVKDLLVSIIHPSRAINDKYRNVAAPNLSTMPPGQINVLNENEVVDLLAYLQSGGNKNDLAFKGPSTAVKLPVKVIASRPKTPATPNIDPESGFNSKERVKTALPSMSPGPDLGPSAPREVGNNQNKQPSVPSMDPGSDFGPSASTNINPGPKLAPTPSSPAVTNPTATSLNPSDLIGAGPEFGAPQSLPKALAANVPKISPSLFPKNSAANLADRPRLFEEMKKVITTYPNATFELVGHADDTRWTQTNFDIATNRARFTASDMILRGIPKNAVSFRAVGDKEPSPVGNRRVEIIVKLK